MTLEQIARLGRKLTSFLALFTDCFGRCDARILLLVYVKGQLSNLHRKTAESIALHFHTAPRTLQRFLESIKWNEEKLRDRCQQIVAKDHAHPEAIGCIDESGTAKSGRETVGAARQWNGHLGKVDNCVVAVHLSYSAPDFQTLLDSRVYLPEDWANDPERRKKLTCPTRSSSVPNRRSRWSRSTALWATASGFQLGHSTPCMVATGNSSTPCTRVAKSSSAKFPAIFMVGCSAPRSYEQAGKRDERADVRSNPRVWLVAVPRAKSAIW